MLFCGFFRSSSKGKREMTSFKHFDAKRRRDVIEIRLVNPAFYDVDSYAELWEELIDFVEQERPRKLLVDFSRVEYCSTAVMNALLIAQKHLQSDGGLMKLYGMNDSVREAFQRLNLDGTAFDIHAGESAAIPAL